MLDQLPAKQRCMVVLDPAGVTSGSREMKEKKKEAEKEGLKVTAETQQNAAAIILVLKGTVKKLHFSSCVL